MNNLNQKGFGLIEIVLVATIAIVVLLSVAEYLNYSLKIASMDISQTEALYFAKSSLEQARAVRDENWANISALVKGDEYHFEADISNPQKWVSVSGTKIVGKYTAWIVSSDVYRDVNDDIVSAGGSLDANTIKITSSVTYLTREGTKQIDLYEYLTNFK